MHRPATTSKTASSRRSAIASDEGLASGKATPQRGRSGGAASAALAAAALLAACASPAPPTAQMISSTQGTTLVRGARVTDMRDVTVRGRPASGIGSLVGSVLGGLAGSAIGNGSGSVVAGVGGAVAGGVAGQQLERSGGATHVTELTVQFDDGDVRTYQVASDEQFRIGDRVKVTSSGHGTSITH